MGIDALMPGLAALREATTGCPEVRIALLDGPVDLDHPCFAGARVHTAPTLVCDEAGAGRMSRHGTHVASLLVGRAGSAAPGVAPGCSLLLLPVFRDAQNRLSQLDLARAVEQAVELGAHVVNISGGELSADGHADPLLERALRRAADAHVLVVAAAGNDGCDCVHVPAAVPSVLAVGALDRAGRPLPSSNWGAAYATHGIVAPGERIVGAVPGGGTREGTGTSYATPIVAGVVALLLSAQVAAGAPPDTGAVAAALLRTARTPPEPGPYLAGSLDVARAFHEISQERRTTVAPSDEGPALSPVAECTPSEVVAVAEPAPEPSPSAGIVAADAPNPGAASGVTGSDTGCACGGGSGEAPTASGRTVVLASYIYALGSIGFDFGTEARRDTFRQLMPDIRHDDDKPPVLVKANPYDPLQLVDYLNSRPSESTKLIWTLNLDLTPIYAVEAEPGYPEDVYGILRDALRRQSLAVEDEDYVARVSVPGVLTGRTVQLFSGQVVPVVMAQPRGMYAWAETRLVDEVLTVLRAQVTDGFNEEFVRRTIRAFLDKVYFECRNLGQAPGDRALNFAATNAYQFGAGIADGFLSGSVMVAGAERELYSLDTISVSKSPYCRIDSDCWDVLVTFFDPVNDRRAKAVYQFTIDVSDELPVTLAPFHRYLTS